MIVFLPNPKVHDADSFRKTCPECKKDFPNLISRWQFNARRKLTARLAEEISKDVAVAIDGPEDVFYFDTKPVKVCQNARTKPVP